MARRRTSPAENPDFELNLPEVLPAEPPADDLSGKKAPFFDYVLDLEPAEAEHCTVWLYRRWPKIQNAPGEKAYIAVIPLPVSPCLEEYIVSKHGGGVYQLFLKKKEPGQKAALVHQLDNWQAAGEPIIPAGTTVLESAAPGAPGAAAGGTGGGLTNEAQLKLLDMASTKQNAGEDVGAVAVRKAVEQAVEIMGMTAKKEAGADPVQNALATLKLMKELNGEMHPAAPPVNQLEQFSTMLRTMRELNAELNPAPARAPRESGGGLALIREAVDLVKGDEEGIVRKLLMGEQEPEPPSGLAAVFGFVQPMLAATPQLPGALGNFLVDLLNRRGPQAPQPRLAPQLQAPGEVLPARAAESQPAGAVTAAEPQPAGESQPGADPKEAMVREVLAMIARAYSAGRTGDYVAHSLNCLYPAIIPDLQAGLGQLNDDAIMAWLQTQAPIRPHLSEPEFADFFADFKAQILAGFEEDPEEEDGGEEVITGEAAVPEPIGAGAAAGV